MGFSDWGRQKGGVDEKIIEARLEHLFSDTPAGPSSRKTLLLECHEGIETGSESVDYDLEAQGSV